MKLNYNPEDNVQNVNKINDYVKAWQEIEQLMLVRPKADILGGVSLQASYDEVVKAMENYPFILE